MKKIAIGFLSFLLANIGCFAQENFSMEEDKVTQYEMGMTEYSKDNEAEALVIFEKGDYRFDFSDHEGFSLKMTIHTKIKILSEAGEKYASFEIPLYKADSRRMELIEQISGATYNLEEGRLIKTDFVSRGNIFEEKINDNWDLKKLTLPNVKVGSVIEFKYTIKTPFFVNMREWKFQKKIPVVYSCLRYLAIPYYEYVYSATNISRFDEQSSTVQLWEKRHRNLVYKEMEHVFGLKDIPAFRDEEFISASKDYMIRLNFQLARIYNPRGGQKDFISTWEALSNDLLKEASFGKYIKDASKEAKKILPTLGLDGQTDNEKTRKISEYVKRNFNWNGFYGKYASQKASELLKTRRGNVADINLFLTGMLIEAGLNVSPVILSTRDHGKIDKNYPFMHYFNYTMAGITGTNGMTFFDATEPLIPDRIIPTRCVNTDALIIEKEPGWAYVRQKTNSYLQKELDIKIKSVNEVEVNAQYGSIGQIAYTYRAKYLGKKDNLIKYLKESEDINVSDSIGIEDYEVLNKPFRFNFTFHTRAEGNEDKIFINPFSNLFSRDNLFKQTNRTFPVDLNESISRRFTSRLTVPDNYKVEFIPEATAIDNEVMSVRYRAEVIDNQIKIDLTYNFKEYIYPAEKYSILKETYGQLLSKLSEMIVLVRDSK